MTSPSQESQAAAAVLRAIAEPVDALPGLARMAKEWPATVAHESQRLIDELHTGNVAGTNWQLCDLAEVICKFSCLVMVCDLQAHSPEHARPMLDRVFQSRPLSFGAWFTLTIDTATAILKLPAPATLLVPELAALFMEPKPHGSKLRPTTLAKWIESTIQFRNHSRGHGAYGTDLTSDATALVGHVKGLDALLSDQKVSWPSRVVLQTTTSGERASDALMGAQVLPTRRSEPAAHAHATHTLPLELKRGQRVLAVSPLIALRRCITCGKQDGFLFDSLDRRSGPPTFFLLDYLAGHRLSLPNLADPALSALADQAAVLQHDDDTTVGDEFSETALHDLLLATDVEARRVKPSYLLDRVKTFCDEREHGILLIEGPGHIGKSVAMVALEDELAKNRPDTLVLRFAVKKELQYTARQLDLSLADKLRKGFGRQEKDTDTTLSLDTYLSRHPGEPPDKAFAGFLEQAMHGPLRPPRISRLVIIIDGLDELRPARHEVPIEALLPGPSELPDDCFLVLTSRPLAGKDVPAAVRARVDQLALGNESPSVAQVLSVSARGDGPQDVGYRKLLRIYFDARLEARNKGSAGSPAADEPKARESQQARADRLFAVLHDKSQGLFGYFAHLTNLVEDGLLDAERAEQLPQGEGLYDNFLNALAQRMAGGASGKPWQAIKQLLLVLVADERAFERESAEWDKWLPPREYRGVPLDVLCRMIDQPSVSYGLVWTLYAFKHLLATWRGSERGSTHWRLGLRDLRQTVERRWPDELIAEHRRMVETVSSLSDEQWSNLPVKDACEQRRCTLVVWHAAWLTDAPPTLLTSRHGLNSFLDRCANLGMPELAVRCALARLSLYTLYEAQDPRTAVDAAQVDVANSYVRLGMALHDLGWSRSGIRPLDEAVVSLLPLCNRAGSTHSKWSTYLASAYGNRGSAKHHAPGHGPSAAILDYDQAINILRPLVDELGDACPPEWRNDLGGAHMNRGNSKQYASGHGPSAAILDYDQAINILLPLVDELGDACPPEWRNVLAAAYMNRGSAKHKSHGPSAAIVDDDLAINIRQRLVDELGDACQPQWRNDLAVTYLNRGTAKRDAPGLGRSTAILDYNHAINILQSMVDELGDDCLPEWRNALAAVYINRGRDKQDVPRLGPSAAILDYDQAINILQALVDELGDACPPEWRFALSGAHMHRGIAKQDAPGLGPSAAILDHDQSITILQPLVDEPGDAWHPDWIRGRIATVLQMRSKLWAALGETSRAAADEIELAAILEHRTDELPSWLIPAEAQGPAEVLGSLRGRGSGTAMQIDAAGATPSLEAWIEDQGVDMSFEVHARWLACLPECLLLHCKASKVGRTQMANLIWGPSALIWLDGTSLPLDAANQWGWVRCVAPDEAADYVKLFCLHVRADHGPFLPVESVDEVPWREGHPSSAAGEIEAKVGPMRCEMGAEDGFIASCNVLYGNSLFRTRFSLDANREVEMLEEEPLAADLPVFRLRTKEGWSWWE